MSQGPQPCKGGCSTVPVGRKVTVEVTIHDVMLDLRPNGVGGMHLRAACYKY